MIKQVSMTEYPTMPLERVEFDHTKTDLIVIDENDNLPLGRLTLSYLLDSATRYPLGYYLGFEPPSYYAVMECLYHAIAPKPKVKEIYGTEHEWIAYGVPNTLVTDQGKELIGNDLTDACESLGIVMDVAPIKTPEFKAGVERSFGTLNTGLFHQLPGTTFSNFLERGDYNSVKQACVSLNDVERALNIFMMDIYSEKFHRGLNGIPSRRWEYAMQTNFFPRFPSDKDTLRILLGRVDYRVIQKYGIEFQRIRYNSQDLAHLRLQKADEKVKIKYHPGDLSRIYVFDQNESTYIEVPALDQEYTHNLSLWKHKVILNYARRESDDVDLTALGRALQKIQDIVDSARSRTKISTRSKIGRWDNSGKPSSLLDRADKQETNTTLKELPLLPKPEPEKLSALEQPLVFDIPSLDESRGWEIVESLPKRK
jgi:putative transposase